jgi:chromosomal replication initiation ATPase DnaA
MKISHTKIKNIVASYYDITVNMIDSVNRSAMYRKPRFIYCYLAYEYSNLSLSDIARDISKNHASVINAIKKTRNELSYNKEFKEEVEFLTAKLFNCDLEPNTIDLLEICQLNTKLQKSLI